MMIIESGADGLDVLSLPLELFLYLVPFFFSFLFFLFEILYCSKDFSLGFFSGLGFDSTGEGGVFPWLLFMKRNEQ